MNVSQLIGVRFIEVSNSSNKLQGHSRSLVGAIQSATYNFLLVFHCIISIFDRFRDSIIYFPSTNLIRDQSTTLTLVTNTDHQNTKSELSIASPVPKMRGKTRRKTENVKWGWFGVLGLLNVYRLIERIRLPIHLFRKLSTLYRFRDIASYLSTLAFFSTPRVFGVAVGCDASGISSRSLASVN